MPGLVDAINQSTGTAQTPQPNQATGTTQNEGLLGLILRLIGKDKAVLGRNQQQADQLNQLGL